MTWRVFRRSCGLERSFELLTPPRRTFTTSTGEDRTAETPADPQRHGRMAMEYPTPGEFADPQSIAGPTASAPRDMPLGLPD